jgi:predicted short-subunit dehydrogenase-like oxidoreductase (DUF2520 family)
MQTLLPGVEAMPPADIVRRVDIVVLAVPDDVLVDVAAKLAASARPGQIVLHTSGRHGLEPLAPFAEQGARVAAFHPAMTFTGTEVDLERTCAFGLTANPGDRALAEALAAELGGTAEWMDEADRIKYHAALAHGANHLTTLVAQAMDILRDAGVDDPSAVLRPLLTAALDNTLTYGDAALTGPVARGDVNTVRAHADTLSGEVLDSYLHLARATAARAAASGRIDQATAAALRQVLTEAEWNELAAAVVIA